MAQHLDAEGSAFRSQPLDAGPYTYLWIDALDGMEVPVLRAGASLTRGSWVAGRG